MNKRRVEIEIHLLAESGNENLHCSCVVLVFSLPDALAKLCTGKNTPGLLHQDLQDVKLTWRKSDALASAGNMTMQHVHMQIAYLEQILGSWCRRASAERF